MPILAVLSFLWGKRSWLPYAVIALLSLSLYVQHTILRASRAETKATTSLLHTAEAANRDDVVTIAALQTSVAKMTKELRELEDEGRDAVQQAALATQELQKRLATAIAGLTKGNPSDDAFLAFDIDATHPDIARSLRDADSNR